MSIVKDILEAIGGEGNAANTAAALGLGTAGLALAERGYSDVGDIGEGEGGDGTGEGEGDEDAVAKPRGMMAASRFQPFAGGGIQGSLPGFVAVEYQPKDYMMELDRIIGESLFEGMI